MFSKDTGVDLTYTEDYNDNNEYFAKIQPACRPAATDRRRPDRPHLLDGGPHDRSGVDEKLPIDKIPNTSNLVPELVNPPWDPEGKYSLPWQSGMTGIAYNLDAAGRELTSMEDLFDPEFKGKIGMLTEMRDTVGLAMLSTGADPTKATFESAQPAFDRIQKAKSDGQIRQFTGNDYVDDLASGELRGLHRLVRRRQPASLEQPEPQVRGPRGGRHAVVRHHGHPHGRREHRRRGRVDQLRLRPGQRRSHHRLRPVHLAGAGRGRRAPQEAARPPPSPTARCCSPTRRPSAGSDVFANLDEETEQQFDERFAEITGA